MSPSQFHHTVVLRVAATAGQHISTACGFCILPAALLYGPYCTACLRHALGVRAPPNLQRRCLTKQPHSCLLPCPPCCCWRSLMVRTCTGTSSRATCACAVWGTACCRSWSTMVPGASRTSLTCLARWTTGEQPLHTGRGNNRADSASAGNLVCMNERQTLFETSTAWQMGTVLLRCERQCAAGSPLSGSPGAALHAVWCAAGCSSCVPGQCRTAHSSH